MPTEPASRPQIGGLGGLLALPNEDPRKLVSLALALCLVCSLAVSSAAVLLRPLQEQNAALALKPERIVVSPGPGTPDEAGISMAVVREMGGEVLILGVCLGMQVIAVVP